jgi:hypothetical protein
LAALIYGPSQVRALVGENVRVTITEETTYPFEESIQFRLSPEREVAFPLSLRVPRWAGAARVSVNGRLAEATSRPRLLTLTRTWKEGDIVNLSFDAEVRLSRWVENSVAVERGPLLYALRIEEDWRRVAGADRFGEYYEVHPSSPWNYALLEKQVNGPKDGFIPERRASRGEYPWTLQGAPLELRTRGKRVPEWQLYNHRAGPLPHSRPQAHLAQQPADDLRLVPYGCTKLRITEFPVVQ